MICQAFISAFRQLPVTFLSMPIWMFFTVHYARMGDAWMSGFLGFMSGFCLTFIVMAIAIETRKAGVA